MARPAAGWGHSYAHAVLGGRSPALIRSEIAQPSNYVALWRMLRRYRAPGRNLGRYLLGRGEYPYRCRARTPRGEVAPNLFSHQDMLTMNEIFCREDYTAGPELRVAVDIGSNIGISALYFLTRNDESRCHLYEPVPENVKRLRENLAGFEDRYVLHETAVADRAGPVEFGVEPTGRYGGIGLTYERSIEVDCLEINRVLDEVLEREGRIDLLKLDTEGMELDTVRAIRPELLRRIGTVYFEWEDEPGDLGADGFERSYANSTCSLRNRRPAAA
jgi:FkbM family methyltransferase